MGIWDASGSSSWRSRVRLASEGPRRALGTDGHARVHLHRDAQLVLFTGLCLCPWLRAKHRQTLTLLLPGLLHSTRPLHDGHLQPESQQGQGSRRRRRKEEDEAAGQCVPLLPADLPLLPLTSPPGSPPSPPQTPPSSSSASRHGSQSSRPSRSSRCSSSSGSCLRRSAGSSYGAATRSRRLRSTIPTATRRRRRMGVRASWSGTSVRPGGWGWQRMGADERARVITDALSSGHSSAGITPPRWTFSNDSTRPVGQEAVCSITFDVPYDLSACWSGRAGSGRAGPGVEEECSANTPAGAQSRASSSTTSSPTCA